MAGTDAIGVAGQPYISLRGRLNDGLLRGLQAMGYENMTPVQQKLLTELPDFTSDCLVQAKTGTGKTLAFLLPAIHSLLQDSSVPKGQVAILVMSPTRELAAQIAKECAAVTAELPQRLECHIACGGTSKDRDLNAFLNGDPKIVVATPGRLNDYLDDGYVADKFAHIRTLVLDEADQMLEAGFLVAINDILRRLPPKAKANWQGMCFSATMPQKIQGVLSKVLRADHAHLTTIDPNETPTIDKVMQHSLVVPSNRQVYPALWELLQAEYSNCSGDFKAIVFGTTANGVALMYALFSALLQGNNTLQVYQLQSRLSQASRTRATHEFKAAKAGIMFASDVIGRGMDFPAVSHVIQIGLPSSGDQYVHRVGRTARAGNEGRAIILLTQRESFFVKVNKRLPITPYPASLTAASGQSPNSDIETALAKVDETTKAKAYQAWLGFHKTFTKQLQLTNETLVQEANDYAEAMGCPDSPMIDKKVVSKMGLKGVRGLNVGHTEPSGASGRLQGGDARAAGRGSGGRLNVGHVEPGGASGRPQCGDARAAGRREWADAHPVDGYTEKRSGNGGQGHGGRRGRGARGGRSTA